MSAESQDYKLEVLEYAVNQSIDRLLPDSSQSALSVILHQSNEVVWKVATEIYTKSGHQLDFVFIRDILNVRVEPLRKRIAEEEKIRAELEAQRLAKIAETERFRKVREAEEARIKAERERIKKEKIEKIEAEKLAKKAEQERIRREKEAEEAKFRQQKEEAKQKKLQQIIEIYPNIDINIFLRIEKIIIEVLELEEEKITLKSILSKDLGADDLDAVELISKLEEEFDIEMPNEYELFGIGWSFSSSGHYSTLNPVSVKEIVDIVYEKIHNKY